MMAKTSLFRAGAMAAYLALSVVGLSLVALPGESVAQTQGGWRKELADKAAQAQAAGQKGNYMNGEAVTLLANMCAGNGLALDNRQTGHGIQVVCAAP